MVVVVVVGVVWEGGLSPRVMMTIPGVGEVVGGSHAPSTYPSHLCLTFFAPPRAPTSTLRPGSRGSDTLWLAPCP